MQQNIPEQIVTCARESLQLWPQLSSSEKTNLSTNIRYAACVIGHQVPKNVQNHLHILNSPIWMQSQGQSNLCGLCALNNLYGKTVSCTYQLDDIADEMWLRQFSDIGLKITDRVQPLRSTVGDYAFHVLDKVVEINGDSLVCLTPKIRSLLDGRHSTSSTDQLLDILNCEQQFRNSFLVVEKHYHYICIHIESQPHTIGLVDSKQNKAKVISVHQLSQYLK